MRSIQSKDSTPKEEKEKMEEELVKGSIMLNLNLFESFATKDRKLIEFPPEFEAITCKPVVFDLANAACEFPSLEARKKPKGGSFWSFWR